ncbi:hypothetical protein JY651_22030 [Pyxidicoccus parkwayensis]|jgi:hypothetical protein|uniref:Lipoprotein n=1 Tax=Pyxidicoccus parkwayensis TaxID=2813578 RepID=A0ABX7PAG2_9BACT|nr:hypothetical protein [Pyxidicoccus parkwaysis]QSQ27426.1 hypothetical protein JY651_22030 [Pyxidicoccus parkwaysis]
MNKKLLAALLMSTALLTSACGDDEKDEAENVDVEGCEHLQKGPGVAVTATTSGTAPSVSNDHRRYDISLADGTGGRTGSVSFAAAEATDYVFFTSADVPLVVRNSSGAVVAIEESTSSSAQCADIKGRHVVPLTVGTHTLTFGPTSTATVSLVIEEASHEGHDHEE